MIITTTKVRRHNTRGTLDILRNSWPWHGRRLCVSDRIQTRPRLSCQDRVLELAKSCKAGRVLDSLSFRPFLIAFVSFDDLIKGARRIVHPRHHSSHVVHAARFLIEVNDLTPHVLGHVVLETHMHVTVQSTKRRSSTSTSMYSLIFANSRRNAPSLLRS